MTLRETFDKILSVVESDSQLNEVFTKQLTQNEADILRQVSRLKAYNRLAKVTDASKSENSEVYKPGEYYEHELSRLVEQFLEREYWYSFRKIHRVSEFEGETYRYNREALDCTNCTWDGEKDILGMIYLKLSHMIYNLKNFGNTVDQYFDSYLLMKDTCNNESDYNWAKAKVIQDNFGKPDSDNYKVNHWNSESSDEGYINRVGLGSDNTPAVSTGYFLTEYCMPDKNYICVEYKLCNESKYTLLEKLNTIDLDEAQKILDKHNINIGNIADFVIYHNYTIRVTWPDYQIISPELKEKVRGNIISVRQLWQLRKYVKQLWLLEDTDDKYTDMWDKAPDDQKGELIKEAEKVFLKDREELYKKICDYMIKYGQCWWD